MSDTALSGLSQTFASGYSTADVMLLLDVADTSMATTGTDKGITVATWLAQYVHAGSNITITAGGTGITIASSGFSGTITTSQVSDLSSWAGSTSITTLGTITTGTWHGTAIAGTYIASTGLAINSCTSVITVDTPVAGAVTCNLSVSNWHQITFAASTTITLSNVGVNQQFSLIIIQGGSGGYTATFSGMTIKWPGGLPPTLTTAVGGIDILTFKQISSGNYYGFVAGAALA